MKKIVGSLFALILVLLIIATAGSGYAGSQHHHPAGGDNPRAMPKNL